MNDAASLHLTAPPLGVAAGPSVQAADAEWLMAYAAALGDTGERYLDTSRAGGIVAHPLFPVCPEWPVWLQSMLDCMPAETARMGVHATQRLEYLRPIRSGETLSTRARSGAARRRRSGLHLTSLLAPDDAGGAPLFRSRSGILLRGVAGEDAGDDALSDADLLPARAFLAEQAVAWSERRDLGAGFAHVYSACSRIWNPIHTDVAAARAAGLPSIILHGTATLAMALSALCARESQERHPRRIAARFLAPVPLPAALRIDRLLTDAADGALRFRVHCETTAADVCIGILDFFPKGDCA